MSMPRLLWLLFKTTYRLLRFVILVVGFTLITALIVEQFLPAEQAQPNTVTSSTALPGEGKSLDDFDAGVYLSLPALQGFADAYTDTKLVSQHGVLRALSFSARLLPSTFSFV